MHRPEQDIQLRKNRQSINDQTDKIDTLFLKSKIFLITTSITRSLHIFMLWQSEWHLLCHNINMWRLLVIFVIVRLYARIEIFKIFLCQDNFSHIKQNLMAISLFKKKIPELRQDILHYHKHCHFKKQIWFQNRHKRFLRQEINV